MKKRIRLGSALLLIAALLAGCSSQELDREALGWEDDWTAVGNVLAVEPLEGFEANENLDAMSASGLWYATWTAGEGEAMENEDGEDATLYDAQIYLLIEECKSASAASAELKVWENQERDNYVCGDTSSGEWGGQEFTVLELQSGKETNPFHHGAMALGARGKFAFSVELLCREDFAGDPQEILAGFLSGIHYNDQEEG